MDVVEIDRIRHTVDSLPSVFHPSPTKQVRLANGKVVLANRKLRRKNGILGIRAQAERMSKVKIG